MMLAINAAYQVLSDPTLRQEYDESLRDTAASAPPRWRDTEPAAPNVDPQSPPVPEEHRNRQATTRASIPDGVSGGLPTAFKFLFGLLGFWVVQVAIGGGSRFSQDVFAYQLLILLTTLAAGVLFGNLALKLAVFCWTIWSLIFVFTTWLSIFQLGTIGFSYIICVCVRQSSYLRTLRRALFSLTGLGIALIAVVIYFEESDRRVSRYQSSPNAEAPVTATMAVKSQPIAEPAAPRRLSSEELVDEVATRIEAEFPMLDSKSQRFSQAALNRVLSIAKQYSAQGQPYHLALDRAARQVMAEPNPETGSIYRCKNNVYQGSPCIEGQ